MTKLYGSLEAGGTKFVCAVGGDNFEVVEKTQFPTTTPLENTGSLTSFKSTIEPTIGERIVSSVRTGAAASFASTTSLASVTSSSASL